MLSRNPLSDNNFAMYFWSQDYFTTQYYNIRRWGDIFGDAALQLVTYTTPINESPLSFF